MVTVPAAVASSQDFTLPAIPELFLPNFLDVLLPPSRQNTEQTHANRTVLGTPPPPPPPPPPFNPMMDALRGLQNKTFTENYAPTYSSTNCATLDAFQEVANLEGVRLDNLLSNAWQEDPLLTLRIIWNLRSIPDGKSQKEPFYRAFGWLYKHHPRTAISNLHLLVEPVSVHPKKQFGKSHGYWKDLLNILALETRDELVGFEGTSLFLHCPRQKYTYPTKDCPKPASEKEARIQAAKEADDRAKVRAQDERAGRATIARRRLARKLESPKYRALYIAVTRLFADRLSKDLTLLAEADQLPADADRVAFLKQVSLAGKWAPTPHLSHDRVTNISTAISLVIQHSPVFPSPASLKNSTLSERERIAILRSVYQRWVLTPLRKATAIPEPLMSSNRWREIRYNRVPSLCMKANKDQFFMHDEDGFQKYLIRVEEGKSKISGATLMPHELVAEVLAQDRHNHPSGNSKMAALREARKRLAAMQLRVLEGQWKTLVDNLREAGTIENSIAVCDVSGSMGSVSEKLSKKRPQPIFPALALSLVLAQLAKPPFHNGFITFSAFPQFITLDPSRSLCDTLMAINNSDWGMNTDLNAVFLKLLLPLAVKNKIKQEDMIKRLFIFSDMQFDAGTTSNHSVNDWDTNHEIIQREFEKHGYEMPEIVYWDLAAYGTVPVTAETKGVALMNGFSAAMLKVFMGEQEDEEAMEWEDVKEDGVVEKVKAGESFDPVSVMKKAVGRKSFEGLVVVD